MNEFDSICTVNIGMFGIILVYPGSGDCAEGAVILSVFCAFKRPEHCPGKRLISQHWSHT